jgi:glucoamylase
MNEPPGRPGIAPRWTSSAKSGVGTALGPNSRVWFTLSHGILNEIYWGRIDQACTRDLGLIVTDGAAFFSEEKRDATSEVEWLADGVPAFRLINTCRDGRYRIEKEIVTDPHRDVLLQRTRFVPLRGRLRDYRLYALLSPHLANRGADNTAWVDEYHGASLLFAQRGLHSLALACSAPWKKRSAGYVGTSDGWQDLKTHKEMTWEYPRAEHGNVALTAEIDLESSDGLFVLSLGFGNDPEAAADDALESLRAGFDRARDDYVRDWQEWQRSVTPLDQAAASRGRDLAPISAAVLRVHESKERAGAIIASLSVPWGFAKGDDDLGGYHVVWPRDLVEAAGALLALGASEDVVRVLRYLQATQDDDGHWEQNMWVDGTAYWGCVQLDETAFPILLADFATRQRALRPDEVPGLWPMVRQAAQFLVLHGPVTDEDRWEEDAGYSPFTLAVVIAALLAAADIAERSGEPGIAPYLRDVADCWNDSIERWTYVSDTEWARQAGVDGYYVRIAPPEVADAASPPSGFVPIKNRPIGQSVEPAAHIVSADALALVRFGLRSPDDPRIRNTVRVIDMLLEVETPGGPAWHRYNDDGYGEHEDGSPFDGTGVGRAWPLLTGERAHYELAAGRVDEARRLLRAMEAFASPEGLIPEQVWDSPDIPERELLLGKPSGSANPLVWAHAEYLKLRRSLQDGRVFDLPPQAARRYAKEQTRSRFALWRFSHKCRSFAQGRKLRVELTAPATVRFSLDDWATTHDVETRDTRLGLHVADLDTEDLREGGRVVFTLRWREDGRWEGTDFSAKVV